jgi:hypothetical protein
MSDLNSFLHEDQANLFITDEDSPEMSVADDTIPGNAMGSTVDVIEGEVLPSTSTPRCDEGTAQEETADRDILKDTMLSVVHPTDVADSTAPTATSDACEDAQADPSVSPHPVRISHLP